MATDSRAVTGLAQANLAVGGIALLGWLAMGLLAFFHQLPRDWVEKLRHVSDVVFLAILFCGPARLAAGIGLLKRRRWGRWLTLGLGGAAGALAVTGFALVCFGVLRVDQLADLVFLGFFAGYSGVVFVTLCKDPEV